MRVANDSLISSPADWSVPWQSQPISMQHIMNFSIQLFFSGSPAGMLRLQCSNDSVDSSRSESTWPSQVQKWTDIDSSEQLIAAAGDHTWSVCGAGYMWVRVSWAPTSGTAQLDSARFTAKGL